MNLGGALLWLVPLSVFALINPVSGMDGRTWAEAVLVVGGLFAATAALSGAASLFLLCGWLIVVGATMRTASTMPTIMMMLAFLGVVALARQHGGARVIRWVVAGNVAAIALQVLGAWPWLLRQIPGVSYAVWNPVRPIHGLTSSPGDVACVLAIGLPFFWLDGSRWRWLLIPGGLALVATQATSGIVAGLLALCVALWPLVVAHRGVSAAIAGAVASLTLLTGEAGALVADDRWRVWGIVWRHWADEAPVIGHGLGAWGEIQSAAARAAEAAWLEAQAGGVTVLRPVFDEWAQAHFDLLQLGYEAGLVGVVLALVAWCALAWQARGNRLALGALVGLAVCQFGHFPLHTASGAVVAALAIGEAQRNG